MQIGDVVYLKSGSRPMTILRSGGTGFWECGLDGPPISSVTYPEVALVTTDPRPALRRAEQSGDGTL